MEQEDTTDDYLDQILEELNISLSDDLTSDEAMSNFTAEEIQEITEAMQEAYNLTNVTENDTSSLNEAIIGELEIFNNYEISLNF